MCGLTGILQAPGGDSTSEVLERVVRGMADTLKHRGPDDSGTWIDAAAGIALGHRRLSIIDLSPTGRQPMVSASGRHVVVFNGEIYNFAELRADLEPLGHRFRGGSDTEVLLAAVEQWGLDGALRRSNGMFAIAIWDRHERILHLARDRIGKKPLYYGWAGRTLVFGSELKALLAFPGFDARVDRDVLALYLRHDYVPAPWSIFHGVFKLPQGTWLSLRPQDAERGPAGHEPLSASHPYWKAQDRIAASLAQPVRVSDADACAQFDELLRDAVRLRMYADVPLGMFLSGGTDSSTVTALMQAQSGRPVLTFSIGFSDPRHDEAAYARAVARHLGTEHTELYVSGDDALALVPRLPQLFDEPFADSSQIPTYLVSQLARRSVTVALSGDGGDELFCGYGRYLRALDIWRWHERVPTFARRMLAPLLVPRGAAEARGSRLAHLAGDVAAESAEAVYRNRISRWRNPTRVVPGAIELKTPFDLPDRQIRDAEVAHRLMYLDLVTYLPDDILVKVDRASMAVSLEARAPLLDYRVVEYAWRLPLDMKLRGRRGKWLLKEILRRYLPDELIDRPKKGFGAPVGEWLRGPLRDWAEALLARDRLAAEGYFDARRIRQIWSEFVGGHRKWHTHLWNVLMFQAWLDWVKQGGRHFDSTPPRPPEISAAR